MTKQARGDAPVLTNFEYRALLGSGGYADVYLYEQQRPRREVAVKVLLAEGMTDAGRRQFAAEADLMATLSAHPAIVTIYEADIAPDGRPYLVMEYYPGTNLRNRARQEAIPVAEVLRIGVQVSSAIETAHRVGIIHRDIKPANILTSRYNKPGLTDFGISASTNDSGDDVEGVSVPWAPPEAFDERLVLDVRSDIYSLGATLYTLLTGRSPFEQVGGGNSQLELMSRIDRAPVPPTGRRDVPASLERLLVQCMSKSSAERPSTALDLALSLQAIEIELHLSPTPIDVMGDGPERFRREATGDGDDDRTRIRGAVTVNAQEPISAVRRAPEAPAGAVVPEDDVATRLRPSTAGPRSGAAGASTTDSERLELSSGRRVLALAWVGSLVAIAAVVVVVLFVSSGNDSDPRFGVDGGTARPAPTAALVQDVPAPPTDVAVGRQPSGDVTVSWTPAGPRAGDQYLYWRTDVEGGTTTATSSTSATVTGVDIASDPCFVVVTVRDGVSSEPGEPVCASAAS